jgi:1-acyl-sn-glycerol-3-phosphate acyltransferase
MKKYAPFLRKDLDDLQMIGAFPFYITYWLRIACGWSFLMFTMIFANLFYNGGKDKLKESSALTSKLTYFLMFNCARFLLLLGGYWWVVYDQDESIDYSEYLGPDWKRKWEGAPTYIANHTSWLDIMYAIDKFFPGFVAKSTVRDTPCVGPLTDILGSVYIERVGEGSKDSKRATIKAIMQR